MMLNALTVAFVFNSVIVLTESKKVLTCYVMFWSAYRDKEGRFSMDYIDPNMCTHIIYSYNGIKPVTQQIVPLDPAADFTPGLGNIERLLRLKDENPELKILVSLGGLSEGSRLFSPMVQSKANRTAFVNNAVKFLRENQLDGLDFDWQHPTQKGGKEEDKNNFPTLLEELRNAFDTAGYTLTVRLVGMRYVIDPGYDVERISKAVHYINLKTFGYHGDWERKSGVNAPLQSEDESNVEFSLHYMIKRGASPRKLLLGIRTGGNAVLMDKAASSQTRQGYMGSSVVGKFAGTLTQQPGFFGYNDYCWEKSLKVPWKLFWHNSSSTPYAVLGKKFISFDNKESLKLKLKLVDFKDLGGASIYSVDSDDFRGYCNNVTFPITKQVRDFLFGEPAAPPFTTNVINQDLFGR